MDGSVVGQGEVDLAADPVVAALAVGKVADRAAVAQEVDFVVIAVAMMAATAEATVVVEIAAVTEEETAVAIVEVGAVTEVVEVAQEVSTRPKC
ncbi:hypothetical protein [Bremerella cremea]|uniref:hypothetical protein n=1 Tax=Bremerella cremea TaxID=1031537 RepID=UPI0031EA678F